MTSDNLLLYWSVIVSSNCLSRVMVFNATFNNISVISWWSVVLMEETGVLTAFDYPLYEDIITDIIIRVLLT
jgi:hypothetical protein